jgi:succinylarginine dihydrolase
MRSNLALGLVQGIFPPQPRPARTWLSELGTGIEEAEPHIAANAMSASAVGGPPTRHSQPGTDTADGSAT